MSASNGSKKTFATVTKYSPGSPFVEAYGLLTTSLMLQDSKNGTGGIHVITVTAAQTGDGSTTTALNLALTAANAGRRTLLIDGNLRNPALHVPFGVPQAPGLAEVLSRKTLFKDAIRASKTSNLYLLPAGGVQGSPHAMFQPQGLAALIEQVKGGFEFAVVDTAPALRYPETLHFSRVTDGTILVVPAEGAPRRAQLEVRRRLERADINLLGIVLNRIDPKEAVRL